MESFICFVMLFSRLWFLVLWRLRPWPTVSKRVVLRFLFRVFQEATARTSTTTFLVRTPLVTSRSISIRGAAGATATAKATARKATTTLLGATPLVAIRPEQ